MINAIIESLTDDDDLTKPLLKTLVFAKRIENKELADWVSKELNGYSDSENLPDYRYAKTSVTGVMRQNGRLTNNVSLPLSCFGDKTAEILMKKRFPDSISAIEGMIKFADGAYIGRDFPADFLQYLTQQAQKNGCKFQVISCRQLVMISELSSINTVIRTKLLNLLLQIEREFPKVDEVNKNPELKSELNSTINYYMGSIYNIHSSGDQNIVNTGDASSMQSTSLPSGIS